MKATDLFVKALENEGVNYVFALPGEENLDLLDSLRQSSIHVVINRHEQAAGFMAATYGRLSGKTGVCLATLGPGATNLMTAAAYAQLGAMPMLMITGQKPILKSKQGRFQIVDIVDMMRPLTKHTKQIVNSNHIPYLVRQSFKVAETERPGAVHLELPEDIAHQETDEPILTVNRHTEPHADLACVHNAAQMIHDAKMPLLLIGAAANRKDTSKALLEFVNKTKIPFFNTQMGKGVIDETHDLYLGTAALSEHDYIHCAIARSDLIINVGHDEIEKPPFLMQHGGTKVIHINFFPANVDEVYFPNLEVVGDITSTVSKLTDAIKAQKHWDFDYYHRIKQEVDSQIREGIDNPAFPILPQRLVHDMRQVMPKDGIVSLDNGMYKIWFARNYKAYFANTLLLDNALASMGAGLPAAIAACLVYPKRNIVTVCGDGGFMMNSQEIETAVRLKVNLTIIVLRDNGYGMIKWKQEVMQLPDYGLDFGNPDFVKYAESYGAKGFRVEDSESFKKILSNCLQTPGVNLIDLPVDYSQNYTKLNKELFDKTCIL